MIIKTKNEYLAAYIWKIANQGYPEYKDGYYIFENSEKSLGKWRQEFRESVCGQYDEGVRDMKWLRIECEKECEAKKLN